MAVCRHCRTRITSRDLTDPPTWIHLDDTTPCATPEPPLGHSWWRRKTTPQPDHDTEQ